MNYKREVIGDKIGFSTIIDEKFNTCSVFVKFITEQRTETASANALADELMVMTNSRYRTTAEMSNALAELYGAVISYDVNKKGNAQLINIYSSWICNRFALENEDITAEMAAILHDCIFSPNVENGGFDSRNFGIAQRDLIDTINSQFNDKSVYAMSQANQIAFRGEPSGVQIFGTAEQVENLTPEQTFSAYKALLETAQIEIFFVSPEEDDTIINMFRESFAEIRRNPSEFAIISRSQPKEVPEQVEEEFDVNQSKMVLTFKSQSDDTFALILFNFIFGGSPVSKLFRNVREKMSLCYYCSSRYNLDKNCLTVESGVDRNNIEKAYDEIMHQLDEMKQGNITDEEIQSALLMMDNIYSATGEKPSQWAVWYFNRFCTDNIMTPQEYYSNFLDVTKERLQKAASSFIFDSSYYMLNKESAE